MVLVSGLSLSLGWLATHCQAEELQWRAASPRPAMTAAAYGTGVTLGRPVPAASLGRPVAVDQNQPPAFHDRSFQPAGFSTPAVFRGQDADAARPMPPGPPNGFQPPPPARLEPQPVMPPPPPEPVTAYAINPVVPVAGDEMYNCGVVTDPCPGGVCPTPGYCEPIGDVCCPSGCTDTGLFGLLGTFQWFKSDHCFDQMISPLSNPFLFEDPRALTEIRPMYIYQHMSNPNVVIRNGNINWWGVQARAAITDRWSLIINKLGGIDFNPGSGSLLPDGTSFSEFWFGPKYTFLRSPSTGSVLAAGITFQFPTGSDATFQGNGDLSIVPYLSYGQTFGRTSWGTFNFMGTVGYSFATDNARSEYFFTSLHLDFDVANAHKFYPLIELNWFHYSADGNGLPLGFEGRDLINFGNSGISGHDGLTMAAGVRYKFTEWAQLGVGVEFPISNTKADLLDYRIMVDIIFKY
jgi:hypothetical protein